MVGGGYIGGKLTQTHPPQPQPVLQTAGGVRPCRRNRYTLLTKEQEEEFERVQKVACKIILKDQYQSYRNALQILDLENLSQRRTKLCKKFALNSLKFAKSKDMFPLDEGRNKKKFKVDFTRHSRLLNSAIPQMQRLLNQ